MGQPVVHWEIGAREGSKLHEFYRTLFDWKIQVDPQLHYGMVETGGSGGINGGISTLPAEAEPYVTFYVQVDDVKSAVAKAEGLGAKVVVPFTDNGPLEFAHLQDPQGNRFGVWRPKG